MHGTSNPPCTRSAEYRRLPVTVATTLPPLDKNKEQIRDIFFGRCPIIVSAFFATTAYLSFSLLVSRSHSKFSPTTASHTRW